MAERDTDHGYLLDNRQSEAGIRFDALSELFDPVTFRHVDRLGIAAGMRCWEVGAGGPSVPLAYGRTLPRLLREAGLDDGQADAYSDGSPPAQEGFDGVWHGRRGVGTPRPCALGHPGYVSRGLWRGVRWVR